jgi:hypothetical protein
LRRGVSLALLGAVLGSGVPPSLESHDPEVLKGVALLEEAKLEEAQETLESAVTRLRASAPGTHELAIAFFYRGAAEAQRGEAARARASMGEAMTADPDLGTPGRAFPLPVQEAFEDARAERRTTAKARRTGLVGALVAGGLLTSAALVFAGSGGRQSPSAAGRTTDLFTGDLVSGSPPREFPVVVSSTGIVDAGVDWIEPGATLALELDDAGHQARAVSTPSTSTEAILSVVVAPSTYTLLLTRRDASVTPANFTLRVTHP